MGDKKNKRHPNYDYKNKAPASPTGKGEDSNLPDRVIMKIFSKSHDYRSGVVNSYACGLDEMSGVDEME